MLQIRSILWISKAGSGWSFPRSAKTEEISSQVETSLDCRLLPTSALNEQTVMRGTKENLRTREKQFSQAAQQFATTLRSGAKRWEKPRNRPPLRHSRRDRRGCNLPSDNRARRGVRRGRETEKAISQYREGTGKENFVVVSQPGRRLFPSQEAVSLVAV